MYTNKEKMQILARRDMAKAERKLAEFLQNDFSKKDHLFYDQFSGEFFKASKATVLAAELAVNRTLVNEGECKASVYYNILGLDVPEYTDYIWKVNDGDNFLTWVDFDHIYVDYEDEWPEYHLVVMIPVPWKEEVK